MASAQKAGAQTQAIQADLGSDAGIQAFVESLKATGTGVDILINNAGSLVKRAKLAEFSWELFDRVMT
jgi:3-oxoacyl-[acyl-carrier protein] reductase